MKKTLYTIVFSAVATSCFAQGTNPVLNPGFETWDSLSIVNGQRIYNPTNWMSSNATMVDFGKGQPAQMTTDAHSGQYALKIVSMMDDGAEQGAYIASGNDIGEGPMEAIDRFPLTGRINGFEGYYKYEPVGSDSFSVFIALYRDGQYQGQAFMVQSAAASTYTKFTWPISFPSSIPSPDSAKFFITPSVNDNSEGSVLFLDDIMVTYSTVTGIDDTKDEAKQISVYPNPATDDITLLGYNPKRPYHYSIHSVNGKLVQSGSTNSNNLNISELANGLYIIDLQDADSNHTKLKIIKQ
jgi:hypothetical protein